jgi:hypothetical protein
MAEGRDSYPCRFLEIPDLAGKEIHQEDLDRAVAQNIVLMCSVYKGSCPPCTHNPQNPNYQECPRFQEFQEARRKPRNILAGMRMVTYFQSR